ncbi:MAG: PKD domain-containing protein [Planctomycetota bacterium]|nr:PKD domain-containing protein [Planctomycetota bacterium]
MKWFFGDQHDSRDVSPTHTYEAPGEYRVTANVELTRGGMFRRQKTISVGRSRD